MLDNLKKTAKQADHFTNGWNTFEVKEKNNSRFILLSFLDINYAIALKEEDRVDTTKPGFIKYQEAVNTELSKCDYRKYQIPLDSENPRFLDVNIGQQTASNLVCNFKDGNNLKAYRQAGGLLTGFPPLDCKYPDIVYFKQNRPIGFDEDGKIVCQNMIKPTYKKKEVMLEIKKCFFDGMLYDSVKMVGQVYIYWIDGAFQLSYFEEDQPFVKVGFDPIANFYCLFRDEHTTPTLWHNNFIETVKTFYGLANRLTFSATQLVFLYKQTPLLIPLNENGLIDTFSKEIDNMQQIYRMEINQVDYRQFNIPTDGMRFVEDSPSYIEYLIKGGALSGPIPSWLVLNLNPLEQLFSSGLVAFLQTI
jgi:hypothetical protein